MAKLDWGILRRLNLKLNLFKIFYNNIAAFCSIYLLIEFNLKMFGKQTKLTNETTNCLEMWPIFDMALRIWVRTLLCSYKEELG